MRRAIVGLAMAVVTLAWASGQAGAISVSFNPPACGSVTGTGTGSGYAEWATVNMQFTTLAPVEVSVTVDATAPYDMFGILSSSFLNNTGQAWTGFHLDLLDQSGQPAQGWPTDMDIISYSYFYFGAETFDSPYTTLDLSVGPGQPVPPGGNLQFGVGVEVFNPGLQTFILRETPIGEAAPVPEPITLAGFALGCMAAGMRIRRK